MKAAALALVVAAAGCAGVPRDEVAWQLLHAVDVAQTAQIAESRCYRESDPLTSQLIGEHPELGGVLVWGVGLAVLHAGVTSLLERVEAPSWARVAWQSVTIANSAYAVKNNGEQGIHPWGSGC